MRYLGDTIVHPKCYQAASFAMVIGRELIFRLYMCLCVVCVIGACVCACAYVYVYVYVYVYQYVYVICVSTCVCVMYRYKCMCVYDTLRKVLSDCFDDEAKHQNNITKKKYSVFHMMSRVSIRRKHMKSFCFFVKLSSLIFKSRESLGSFFFFMLRFNIRNVL